MSRVKRIVCVLYVCLLAMLTVGSSFVLDATVVKAEMTADNLTVDQAEELVYLSLVYSPKAENTKQLITIMAEMGYPKPVMKKAYQLVTNKYKTKNAAIQHFSKLLGEDISKVYNGMYNSLVGSDKPKGGKISKMDFSSVGEQLYTGKAIKPAVMIMDGGYQLKKGKDYTITYKNNIKIGTATITVKGLGKYTGSVKKTFSIVAIKSDDIQVFNINMAEIVNKNVHLTWRKSGNKHCDSIQILRSDKENGTYSVIATVSKSDVTGSLMNGYIDKTANGKSYYYAVRAVVKVKDKNNNGKMSTKVKAVKTNEDWYLGNSGYIRVIKEKETMDRFTEFTLNGDIIWNCDWYSNYREEEISWTDVNGISYMDSVNYALSTPQEYYNNGQTVNVSVYYGKNSFYYIWIQDDVGFKKSFKRYN